VDNNINSTIDEALKTQKTVTRARNIPYRRARVDVLVDVKTNARIRHRRVEEMKCRVGGAVSGWNEQVMEKLLDSNNRKFRNLLIS
jgi:hypothetical protein